MDTTTTEKWRERVSKNTKPLDEIITEALIANDDIDSLNARRRRTAFWQKLTHIPAVTTLDFSSWDELVGAMYDRGITVKEGQILVSSTFHHLETFTGNIVGLAIPDGLPENCPRVFLDSRLL